MKTVIIGTGYVGLVSGTCFAELGNEVVCVDKDNTKIEGLKKGIMPIYEKGLTELVKKNYDSGTLKFSTDIEKELPSADLVFIAVGTPSAKDGSADLSFVFAVAETVAKHARNGVVIVTKSTVPVGTGDKIKALIQKLNPSLKYHVASNPEFLREGNAVIDFLEPDRVVVGVENSQAFEIIAKLYKKIADRGIKVLETDIRTAEMTKYTANAFLAMKVAFINEVADICENLGANVEKVAEGIGLDHRINPFFLKPGPGFGGSCFPKDTLAMNKIAQEAKAPSKILESVISANDARKLNMVKKIEKAVGGSVKGKNIGILGVAFKANTDDIRDSSALVIIEELNKKGATLYIYDPEAMENGKAYFKNDKLNFVSSRDEVINNTDIISIITEWDDFKKIDLNSLKGKTLIDLRNLYNPLDAEKAGVKYFSLGR